MKYLLLIFLLISSRNSIAQQNLVPNPSFEDTVYCPFGANQIDACANWINFGNSPDYFNICTPLVGIPYNFGRGYQFPHSGNGMAGICTYRKPGTPSGPNYREFIGAQLIQPLNVGTKYFLSLYVNFGFNLGIATDKIGISFLMNPADSCCPPHLSNTSAIFTDSILSDSVQWINISGEFVADSNYQYISIGNFFDDFHTDTTLVSQNFDAGFYFIDDICVSTDSMYNQTWTSLDFIQEDDFLVFPNPNYGDFLIRCNCNIIRVEIFNSIRLTQPTNLHRNAENWLFKSNVPEGLYIIQIYTDKGVVSKKVLIIH